MTGYVHVYTGDGKGKTTAALGLALRAAGAGLRTYIVQFAKGVRSSELDAIESLSDRIVVRQFGGEAVAPANRTASLGVPSNSLAEIDEIVRSGVYSLVILDEINIAVLLGLIPVDSVLNLLDARSPDVELVLTGRGADPRVIARADLVTEMREVKHYYRDGVMARRGIES